MIKINKLTLKSIAPFRQIFLFILVLLLIMDLSSGELSDLYFLLITLLAYLNFILFEVVSRRVVLIGLFLLAISPVLLIFGLDTISEKLGTYIFGILFYLVIQFLITKD